MITAGRPHWRKWQTVTTALSCTEVVVAARKAPPGARQRLSLAVLLAATLLQVPGDQDIADFLSALEDSSTAGLGGIYASALPLAAEAQQAEAAAAVDGQPAAAPAVRAGSKVQAVCAAVRAALEQRDKVRRLLTAPPGGGVGGMELRIAGMLLSHAA